MVHKQTVRMIKRMSNKELVNTVKKIRKEKANPSVYGKGGSSRWVTSSEFWGGHHGVLNKELAKRRKAGKIHKRAGKPKRSSSYGYGLSGFSFPKIRF